MTFDQRLLDAATASAQLMPADVLEMIEKADDEDDFWDLVTEAEFAFIGEVD